MTYSNISTENPTNIKGQNVAYSNGKGKVHQILTELSTKNMVKSRLHVSHPLMSQFSISGSSLWSAILQFLNYIFHLYILTSRMYLLFLFSKRILSSHSSIYIYIYNQFNFIVFFGFGSSDYFAWEKFEGQN